MSENSECNQEKRKNRKRKKSFLQNARKYGKKGIYGRGSSLSEDTYQYFVRSLELYKEGFPTEEEKSIFANNVLEQTEDQEVNCSSNQIGCRVIETLLPYVNFSVIKRFIKAFDSNLRSLCSDRYATHVLQALVEISCKKSISENDEETKNECKTYTLKISKFLLNNLEDFVHDIYGNHVIRTVLKCLSNFTEVNKTKLEETTSNPEMPEEFTDIVREYGKRLMSWPQFIDMPYNELTSGLLQMLLQALWKVDVKLLKKIQKKLLDESFAVKSDENNELPDVFDSKPAIMLLETSITVAASKAYTQMYAKCFVGNLIKLAELKETNFTVQKLLTYCEEKTEFEAIFDELSDSFEEILRAGYTGVILAIAQTCNKLVAKQGSFIQHLMKALHCEEPQERQNSFIAAVVRLMPFETLASFQNKNYYVNLHGSLILQTMLEFNKPIKIVNSILSMECNDLKELFCDIRGSHIIDSYMKSQYVGEKSREKLIRKLQGTYQELAASKHGSRSLETIWHAAQPKQRINIMNELVYKDGAWSNSQFGRIIWAKFQVECYKRNKDEWKQLIGKEDKTKNLFADIIEK